MHGHEADVIMTILFWLEVVLVLVLVLVVISILS